MGALNGSVSVSGHILRTTRRAATKTIAPVAFGVVGVVLVVSGAVFWIAAEFESKAENVRNVWAYHKHKMEAVVDGRRNFLAEVGRQEFVQSIKTAVLKKDLARLAVIQSELNGILSNFNHDGLQLSTPEEEEALEDFEDFVESVQSQITLIVLMIAEGVPRNEVAAAVDLDEISALAALNTLVTIASGREIRRIERLEQLVANLSKTGRNSLLLIPVFFVSGAVFLGAYSRMVVSKQAAEKSRMQADHIFEVSPDAVLVIDKSGKIRRVNDEAEELFGYRKEDLLNLDIDALVPERIRGRHAAYRTIYVKDPVLRSMGTGNDLTFVTEDGREIAASISLAPCSFGKEELTIAVVRDATSFVDQKAELERRKQELEADVAARTHEAINAKNQLFAAMDASPDAFALLDDDGRFIFVTKRFWRYYAKAYDQLVPGKHYEDFLESWENYQVGRDPSRDSEFAAWWRNSVGVAEIETGDDRWVRLSAAPVSGVGTIVVQTDITSYKAQEAVLTNQSTELEKALESEKEHTRKQLEFVRLMSHEFRTPLTVIDSTAQRIKRRFDKLSPEDVSIRVEEIRAAVAHMTTMIDGTLQAERADSGALTVNAESLDLGEILEQVCERMRRISPDHRISCNASLLTNPLTGDRELLALVIENLLTNAIKYSPGNGDIEVVGDSGGGDVTVAVRDYGIGIPKDEMPRLFEKFFRASTSIGIAGTGVGLRLVKDVVALHGGDISVDSEVGVGTTFTVTLPLEMNSDGGMAGADGRGAGADGRHRASVSRYVTDG
jgi:PAS domain S-box-containing protein